MCGCKWKKNVTAPVVKSTSPVIKASIPMVPRKNVDQRQSAAQEYQNRLRSINWMPQTVLPATS